jgi:hypothetical protein
MRRARGACSALPYLRPVRPYEDAVTVHVILHKLALVSEYPNDKGMNTSAVILLMSQQPAENGSVEGVQVGGVPVAVRVGENTAHVAFFVPH